MEIAPGIRRLGEGLVNVYLLEEAALPGHGEPWRGDLAEAVRLVRASVPSLATVAA